MTSHVYLFVHVDVRVALYESESIFEVTTFVNELLRFN